MSTSSAQEVNPTEREKSADTGIDSDAMPLSPRSPIYERLENGLDGRSSSEAGGKRMKTFAWRKLLVAATTLIVLLYLFDPRELTSPWTLTGDCPDGDLAPRPPEDPPVQPNPPYQPQPPSQPDIIPNYSADPPPTSFETDSNPSGTVYCTEPYLSSLPIVQYAILIDAGSTGSRIHVYKFNNCKSSPSHEYETFSQTRRSLSEYIHQPEKGAQSLDVLMKEAMRVIPGNLRKCTPVGVKATAGIRLLGVEKTETILRAVRRRLENKFPFKVVEGTHGVEIMEHTDAGVYTWITANYLLETIHTSADPSTTSSPATHAVLELGGASARIVFEPRWEDDKTQMLDGEHKYGLKFGTKHHVLYQHLHLGYGLMQARRRVHQLVESIRTSDFSSSDALEVRNPCLARGTKKTVEIAEIEGERIRTTKNVVMTGSNIGSFVACNRIVQRVIAKDSICEVKPCSFNGVYQPSLLDAFSTGKVLLSSYYDLVSPHYPIPATRPKFTVGTFSSLAETVCQGRSAWVSQWGENVELMQELEGRPEFCLDLTFVYSLLNFGYGFDADREVIVEKELGWALGAAITMISGDELTCRA